MALHGDVPITKVDHGGRALITYPGRVVYADAEQVVARCAWTHNHVVDLGPFSLEPGDIFYEFYYFEQFFNVFAIYTPTGCIKGWYCNVTALAEIGQGEIRWHDLALDLLVLPDGRQEVLDRDEFEALSPSVDERAQATAALATLAAWVNERRSPFHRQLLSPPAAAQGTRGNTQAVDTASGLA